MTKVLIKRFIIFRFDKYMSKAGFNIIRFRKIFVKKNQVNNYKTIYIYYKIQDDKRE